MKNHVIALDFMRSEKNLIDHLTKGLSKIVVLESSRRMWLRHTKKITAVEI